MRNITIIFLLLIFSVQLIFCQEIINHPEYYIEKSSVYSSSGFCIELFSFDGKYNIVKSNLYNDNIISTGKMKIEDNTIICIDSKTKLKIIFKKNDKYSLTVINKNNYFKNNETIYLIEVRGLVGVIETMEWKKGKRNGHWSVFTTKGINNFLYDNGILKKKSFQTWEDIHSKQPKL